MKKIAFNLLIILFFCGTLVAKETNVFNIINPVLPGDRPDPTIIKIGDTYWASATSNEWSPLFPIFKSKDMLHWELVSYVFPGGAPDWALNNFWAPELAYDEVQKKVYMYYTARVKATGRLAIAVASADRPDGKYTDHGVLVSQEPGSIDAFEIKDNDGKIYVAWKEDGNSMGRPTPIWLQEINPERTRLLGNPIEMFRNNESDNSSWERWLIEGVCIFKKGDYLYATYSGGSCCDKKCNYKTGVARAKKLTGPWEKYTKNPILTDNSDWKCAGHGTVVEKDDNLYMLYHAYNTTGDVFVGRQGVLEKIEWTDDAWPVFKNDAKYNRKAESLNFTDKFSGSTLNPVWQWRVTQDIEFSTGTKGLKLKASTENEKIGTLLVQQTKSLNYTFSADIDVNNSGNNVMTGLALVGASNNGFGAPLAAMGISVGKTGIEVWKQTSTGKELLIKKEINTQTIQLKMKVDKGYLLSFGYESGKKYIPLLSGVDASGLVPWGMGFRFGIVSNGPLNEYSAFKKVELINHN